MSSYIPNAKRQRIMGQADSNNNNNNNNFISKRNDLDINNNFNNSNINNMMQHHHHHQQQQPSHVVHARNLSDSISEADVYQALEIFGKINCVVMMPKKRQALIEFIDISGAMNCVNEANRSVIIIGNSPAYLNYSSSPKIIRHGIGNIIDDDNKPENHILLFTILNPLYPITVDVMHTICSSVGKVLRTVIFRKNGVQAMVEFTDIDTARKAKQTLNGADVYSGCCTLKIEYAKPTKLNVVKNDQDSWDYTIEENETQRKQPLLQTPYFANGKSTPFNFNQPNNMQTNTNFMSFDAMNDNSFKNSGSFLMSGLSNRYNTNAGNNQHRFNNNNTNNSVSNTTNNNPPPLNLTDFMNQLQQHFPKNNTNNFNQNRNIGGSQNRNISQNMNNKDIPSLMSDYSFSNSNPIDVQQTDTNQIVLMIYNLCPKKFNCDRLFNLLCLYGNVDRIKFLISKEGSAMVQMSNADPIYPILPHLNNTYIFGKKLQIHVSKQNVLQPVPRPKDLSDGTTSYKDYQGNRNNRYLSGEAANKNKPLSPANVLHWFNAPPGINEQQIIDIFVKSSAKQPTKVKVFPKTDKSSTGLVEWNNIADCVEALVLANHSEITHSSSKFPYIFKLCFSATPILDGTGNYNNKN